MPPRLLIALAVGFDWDDANLVASANQAVDENVETWPTEHIAFGIVRDNDQLTQFAFKNFVTGLSPQDHYFHCFSRMPDSVGVINDDVRQYLAAREQDVLDIIRHPDTMRTKTGRQQALINIGVYLHCQQDSWSHNQYGGNPAGHVWDSFHGANPDHPAMHSKKNAAALRETRDKLFAFASAFGIGNPVGNDELEQLIKPITEKRTAEIDWTTSDRILCNEVISRY
jgi:hypothetical protein